jgi:hypothetical protein
VEHAPLHEAQTVLMWRPAQHQQRLRMERSRCLHIEQIGPGGSGRRRGRICWRFRI